MSQRTAVASLGRHKRTCSICRHSKCKEIESDFITWRSPAAIAKEYRLSDRSSVYRHAHALGLFAKRQWNIRAALERIIEKAGEVDVTASAVVAAVQAYSKINAMGQWIDRSETVDLNELFDRMTREELEAYAHDGTLPGWFKDAQLGKDPDEAKAEVGESVYERLFATMRDSQEGGTQLENRRIKTLYSQQFRGQNRPIFHSGA
jgi:hypothetical protein